MYTQCPECQTVFQVTPADLAVAAGTVRCGECSVAFNALVSLRETPFAVTPPTLSSAATGTAATPRDRPAAQEDAAPDDERPDTPPPGPDIIEDARDDTDNGGAAADPVIEPRVAAHDDEADESPGAAERSLTESAAGQPPAHDVEIDAGHAEREQALAGTASENRAGDGVEATTEHAEDERTDAAAATQQSADGDVGAEPRRADDEHADTGSYAEQQADDHDEDTASRADDERAGAAPGTEQQADDAGEHPASSAEDEHADAAPDPEHQALDHDEHTASSDDDEHADAAPDPEQQAVDHDEDTESRTEDERAAAAPDREQQALDQNQDLESGADGDHADAGPDSERQAVDHDEDEDEDEDEEIVLDESYRPPAPEPGAENDIDGELPAVSAADAGEAAAMAQPDNEPVDESALFSLPLPELRAAGVMVATSLPEKREGGEAAIDPSAQAPQQDSTAASEQTASDDGAAATAAVAITTALRGNDAVDADDARDLRDYLRSPPRGPLATAGWIAGCITLALALVAQFVHAQRGDLVLHPRLGGFVTGLYASLDMEVTPNWRVTDYNVVGEARLIQMPVNDDDGGAAQQPDLRFVAIIANGAERPQPPPLVRLTLRDRWGDPTGVRDFTPPEYLTDRSMVDRLLEPGQRLRVVLNLRAPVSEVDGFEFDLCLPDSDGTLRCAKDPRVAPPDRG